MTGTDKQKKQTLLHILYLLLALSVAVALYSGYRLYSDFRMRQEAMLFYAELANAVATEPPTEPTTSATTPIEAPTKPPWRPYVDFAKLKGHMPDLIAWIRTPDTVIDYPVVQYSDNDFYLTYLANRTWNPNGAIFLDYRNAADFSDRNSLIYGHHLRTGDMFSSLTQYKDQSYYEAHPVVQLYTALQDYDIVLFSGYLINPANEVPPLEFEDDADFTSYVDACKARSSFKSLVEVSASDVLVTLVTCDFAINDGRYILIGKLVATASAAAP